MAAAVITTPLPTLAEIVVPASGLIELRSTLWLLNARRVLRERRYLSDVERARLAVIGAELARRDVTS
jgi:hypothetical protein